ncbi:MAG TPA: prepilin-type N-terminal cleavage/methylation domain-containing protein [Methylibium sp.]|uniref:PilW family protein n=1 Tax=Methylibium sp. TaxID=2067992 RepID=UPI002DBCFF66|nr:prepilin-type N-terminal cleavage/methylation domain-containing protein [Methylibium sp.]HEU4457540.1 prepilin-type N-terminal cleavage/methylation domain-containing protein [Methylibium sp.]
MLETLMPHTPRRRCAGFTLVELLVGCALGLALGAIALSLFAQQVRAQRERLVEARLQQDLSAAADLLVRGLRRAGHRGLTLDTGPNPYGAIELGDSSVVFGHSRDGVEDGRLDPHERAGFRLADGALQAQVGGRWQALTDPAVVAIEHFGVVLDQRRIDDGCARLTVRLLRLEIVARPARQREPLRRMHASVMPRNDDTDEAACAAPA